MPWNRNDYPKAMKNLPRTVRGKAIEIANAVLKTTGDEGKAIAVGISKAKSFLGEKHARHVSSIKSFSQR